MNNDSHRSQNRIRLQNVHTSRLKLIHTTTWLPPAVRAELERIADCESLTLSQTIAAGLGEWVRKRLHDQHEALLYPVLRQLLRDELTAFGNRLVFFLMRIAFAAEQARILITNVLHRILIQHGVPSDKFNDIIDKSNKLARKNIIAKTPQIKSLMEEWWQSEPEDPLDKNADNKRDHKTKLNRKENT